MRGWLVIVILSVLLKYNSVVLIIPVEDQAGAYVDMHDLVCGGNGCIAATEFLSLKGLCFALAFFIVLCCVVFVLLPFDLESLGYSVFTGSPSC